MSIAATSVAISACAPVSRPVEGLVHGGYQSLAIDDGLVNFLFSIEGAESDKDLRAYGDCIAAQYALNRGRNFVRHVRTSVKNMGGNWTGDAVYSISPTLPQGRFTLDAEIVVQNCAREGIPTV